MRMFHWLYVALVVECVGLSFSAEVKLKGASESINQQQHVFTNFSIYLSFLDDLYFRLGVNSEVSFSCQNQSQILLNKVKDENVNALKILDSSGKPSSGFLEGGIFYIGFYSECVNAVVNIADHYHFSGKFCLIELDFSNQVHHKGIPDASWLVLTQSERKPTIGICIPSSCSEEDLGIAVNQSLKEILNNVEGHVPTCHKNPTGFTKDIGAICTLCIILIFSLIAAIGTMLDCVQDERICNKATNIKSASTEVLCEKPPPKRNICVECFLAFSFKRNAKKVFFVEDGQENTRSLHGLKFLSMALIILGHTFSFASRNLFFRNPGAANQTPKGFLSQVFANGTLAVDTFYVISGLLVAFVTLKLLKTMDGKFPLVYFYFHRYFRLTPLLMIVVMFCAFLLKYIGSGPNWLATIVMYDVWCKENGWINALYLHNFINTEYMCLSHSWYLATDMQFYLVVPLILIPLYKNIKYGLFSMFVFLFATTLTTALLTVINHYPAIPYINNIVPLDVVNSYYKNVYIKPYCRMGPYIIGIAAGYYMLHHKELVLKKTSATLLWISSVTLGLTIIYLMWPANQGFLPTDSEAAAYSALARTTWAVTIAWLVLACFYGYGGFINSILSLKLFVPLSRLTYAAYLIHPVVMNVYYGCTETTVDYTLSFVIYLFLGNLCITYVLSTLLCLLFESPFVALEKILLSKKKT